MSGRRLAWAAAFLGAAPFLLTAPLCGLYLDDYSFLRMLEGASPHDLWVAFLRYVPGRNLHIPIFYGLLELTRSSVPALQLIGVGFDALNAALLFLLIRRLTGRASVALAATAAFAVAPNHGETHFWITLIPQCRIPTALTLGAFLLAAEGALSAACAVYALAMFTYDQVFFLWPLLLLAAWRSETKPLPGRYAAAGLSLFALNVAHISLRYLSPYADGGRPLIRLADFFHRMGDAAIAVVKGVIPWPTRSHVHWTWTVPVAVLSVAAAVVLIRTVRESARREAREASLVWAGAGAAWTVLAYLPNFFWYLSPRHNLLPSAGWSLSLASLGAYAASRDRRAAAALPWIAGLFFAAAAVSDVHEGTQWIDSRRLRDDFAAEVRTLPPPVNSVFLIGAPRYLRRAPAFNLPHDVVMAAGRALGTPSLEVGDYKLAPTRRGVVFGNDLSLVPAWNFRWLPAGEVNLLVFDPAARSFSCASKLDVTGPDGTSRRLDLRAGAGCERVERVIADASLSSSSAGPAARPADDAPRAGGLSLLRARVAVRGETAALELLWRVESPPRAVLAYLPRLRDAEGRVVLDSVFPARVARQSFPMSWPLVDDLAPDLPLRAGGTLRQVFLLRRIPDAPAAALELDVFEISPAGVAVPLGTIRRPLAG